MNSFADEIEISQAGILVQYYDVQKKGLPQKIAAALCDPEKNYFFTMIARWSPGIRTSYTVLPFTVLFLIMEDAAGFPLPS